jgi:hypothetical protein
MGRLKRIHECAHEGCRESATHQAILDSGKVLMEVCDRHKPWAAREMTRVESEYPTSQRKRRQ